MGGFEAEELARSGSDGKSLIESIERWVRPVSENPVEADRTPRPNEPFAFVELGPIVNEDKPEEASELLWVCTV